MALITNNYNGVDLLATATELDKRLAALEGNLSPSLTQISVEILSRLSALEVELAAIKAALNPPQELEEPKRE